MGARMRAGWWELQGEEGVRVLPSSSSTMRAMQWRTARTYEEMSR